MPERYNDFKTLQKNKRGPTDGKGFLLHIQPISLQAGRELQNKGMVVTLWLGG